MTEYKFLDRNDFLSLIEIFTRNGYVCETHAEYDEHSNRVIYVFSIVPKQSRVVLNESAKNG